jgi:hypothetical protein
MRRIGSIAIFVALIAALTAVDAAAQGGRFRAQLIGFEEVPALSTSGHGTFFSTLRNDGEELHYTLRYFDLTGAVTQAHIHFGQKGVNGGIAIFLCSNLGNGPAGTQACPASPATVTGTITALDVIGPNGQGIGPEEWEEVKRAIRQGIGYVNVHSDLFIGGEIRGQLRTNRGDAP